MRQAVVHLAALEDLTLAVTMAVMGTAGRQVAEAPPVGVGRLTAEAAPADLAGLGADARTTTAMDVALVVDDEEVQETLAAETTRVARMMDGTLLMKATMTGEGVDVVAR